MLRKIAVILFALSFLNAGALAQGSTIREAQFTTYLLDNDFNGDRIADNCGSNDGLFIEFYASADQPNLRTFLDFLKIRPEELRDFNGGQFSQITEALGYGVEDVCMDMLRIAEKIDADAPVTDYDPVVEVVNLSAFRFEYRFRHIQPNGSLPLAERAVPIVELDAQYDDDTFPDAENNLWTYQTAELIVTINNYEYFGREETGDPAMLSLQNGSFPCYYKHPTLRAVYRHAWEDCNPYTYIDEAPKGMNLDEAVKLLTVDFIEQNMDIAAPRTRTEEEPETVCCRERGGIFGKPPFETAFGECREPGSNRFEIVPARLCQSPTPDVDPAPTPRQPDRTPDTQICCEDFSGYAGSRFFRASRAWCERQDRHQPVADRECRNNRSRQICCWDYRGINPNAPENYFWTDRLWCEDQDGHQPVRDESLCRG